LPCFALVIGNAEYAPNARGNSVLKALEGPAEDAKDMAKLLTKHRFNVFQAINANKDEMYDAIDAFLERLHKGAVALVYYSGHGVAHNGNTYLMPTDWAHNPSFKQKLQNLDDTAIKAQDILDNVEDKETTLNLMLLDSCRVNDLPGTKAGGENAAMAPLKLPSGSLVGYATQPGDAARPAMAGNRNSVYTKYLLKYLGSENLAFEEALKHARKDVMKETSDYFGKALQQRPKVDSETDPDVTFALNVPYKDEL